MSRHKKLLKIHKPVLVAQVIEALKLDQIAHSKFQARKFKYIDSTVGTGGHTIEIVKRGGNVLGIDADRAMLKIAGEKIKSACPSPESFGGSFKLVLGNFKDIYSIATRESFCNVDGVLFDLGVSSLHFQSSYRGFSYKYLKAPLDMRIDRKTLKLKASDLLNILRYDQLIKLFSSVLTKIESKRVSRAIVEQRKNKQFLYVGDFLDVLQRSGKANPVNYAKPRLHAATLPFMALRMAVNSELDNLKEGLNSAFDLLKPLGRLVVISFHSGEDRVVKNFFKSKSIDKEARVVTKKPVVADDEEKAANPMSRSSKLRILERI